MAVDPSWQGRLVFVLRLIGLELRITRQTRNTERDMDTHKREIDKRQIAREGGGGGRRMRGAAGGKRRREKERERDTKRREKNRHSEKGVSANYQPLRRNGANSSTLANGGWRTAAGNQLPIQLRQDSINFCGRKEPARDNIPGTWYHVPGRGYSIQQQ